MPRGSQGGDYSTLSTVDDVDTGGVQRDAAAAVGEAKRRRRQEGHGLKTAAGPPRQRTTQQSRWRNLLAGAFAGDVLVCTLLARLIAGPDDAGGTPFERDTQDLLLLCIVRLVLESACVCLALRVGVIRASTADTLPHLISAADRTRDARSQSLRVACLIGAFGVGPAGSVYTGIKCIVFDFRGKEEVYMAPMLAASVALINFEYVCVKKLVAAYVIEAGVVVTPLHVHKLKFYMVGAKTSKRKWVRGGLLCDICRDNVGAKPVYNCKQCNFNICVTCFETKSGDLQGDEEENVVRTDRGRKVCICFHFGAALARRADAIARTVVTRVIAPSAQAKTVLTSFSYIRRTIGLAQGNRHLILCAFSFLCVASISGVMLPSFQGQVLDHIISNDRPAFVEAMGYYIFFNVAQVLFGVMRQVCFSVIGKRIQFAARNRLFTSILRQVRQAFSTFAVHFD
jgi:hypothetical protein